MAKLKDVMAQKHVDVHEPTAGKVGITARRISTDEAAVVAKLGMSGANDNEKARRVLNLYLEGLVGCADISDDDARAAISILKEVATSFQKDLCNKILTKYLGKFDAFFPKAKTTAAVMEAAPAGKAEAVAA